jgi:hypothetical protein
MERAVVVGAANASPAPGGNISSVGVISETDSWKVFVVSKVTDRVVVMSIWGVDNSNELATGGANATTPASLNVGLQVTADVGSK